MDIYFWAAVAEIAATLLEVSDRLRRWWTRYKRERMDHR